MSVALVVAAAGVGLAAGPWLNRLIARVPGREPLRGALRCPTCEAAPAGLDRLPLLGALRTRLACRGCGQALGWSEPAVDAASAALFAVTAASVGWRPELAAYLLLAACLVVVTVIDLDHHRIPDRIVFPTLAAGVVLLGVASLIEGDAGPLAGAAAGAALSAGFLFPFWWFAPSGLGFGDVKLALVLGFYLGWLGWYVAFVGLVLGVLAGAVIGLVLLPFKGRRAVFPYGPALCAGAFAALLLAERLGDPGAVPPA